MVLAVTEVEELFAGGRAVTANVYNKGARTSDGPYVIHRGMYVCEVCEDGLLTHYLSILDASDPMSRGLPSEAILGQLTAGPDHVDAEHFEPNPVFVKFLGWVIARHAAACPGLAAAVARQRDGFVYISDRRVLRADGSVAPEDLIGAVEIREGQILRFVGSPNYRAFTDAGPPQLDPWFHARWMEELRALGVRT